MANIVANQYEQEAQEIARRRAFAEALRQQGMAPMQNEVIGGVRRRTGILDGLNKLVQAYSGRVGVEQADQQTRDLSTRRQEAMRNFFKSMPQDQSTTTQQLVGDRPGAGSFEDVTTTKKATPEDYMRWMASGAEIGPDALQLGQIAYQGALRGQERADDRQFKTETLKEDRAFREQQAEEARQQRMVEIQLRLQDAQLSREQNAQLRRELAQLAASNKQSAQPYFQAVSTPQGVMAFNARTGQMEPVRVGGQAVSKASDDPTLQGEIAGAKEGGKQRAKNEVEAQASLPGYIAESEQTVKLVDDLLKHPGKGMAVGGSSVNPLNYVPGTEGRDFRVRLEQIQGKQFLQAFESLKGGGQITEVEGQKATAAISRMNTAQSEKEFDAAAREFQSVIKAGVDRAKRKAMPATPVTSPGAPVAPSIDDLLNRYGG